MRLAAVFVLSLSLSLSLPAGATGWDDYDLGDFYPVADVDDAAVREVAAATVFFGNATGFVISPDGLILTNHHVYQSFGDRGTVYLAWTGGKKTRALKVDLVRADESVDAALYRVRGGKNLPHVTLRAAPAVIGEDVFVVGHPSSKAQRVSFGRVLATGLHLSGRPSIEYSAQTWWGSSGSPVADRAGHVIALHWGWDEDGLSNGRLTGVPVAKIAAEFAQMAALVGDACARPGAWQVATTVVATGKRLYTLDVRLAADAACLARLDQVTWTLHPTFSPSTVDGDASDSGAVELRAWGMFATRAAVRLDDGTTIAVAGRVGW